MTLKAIVAKLRPEPVREPLPPPEGGAGTENFTGKLEKERLPFPK
jgi:hypothetical protein